MSTQSAPVSAEMPAGSEPGDKGLKSNAIGFASGVVIGVASTAPGYSLAASLGLVVAVVGVGVYAPVIMIAAFIPMLLIAASYYWMNRADPDCGTTFSWVTRAMGPGLGWIGGWAIIVADVIVMANLAQIAGSYSFTFVGQLGIPGVAELADSTLWSTVAGLAWIAIMTYICYRGIEISARLQYVLLYTVGQAALAGAAADVTAAAAAGALEVGEEHGLPLTRFTLAETAAAHDAVERGTVGKVLVDVPALSD